MAEGGQKKDLGNDLVLGSEDGDLQPPALLGSVDGDPRRSMLLGSEDGDPRRSMLLGSDEDGDLQRSALLGFEDGELRRSMLLGSEDGDLRRSILLGSEDGDLRRSMMLGSEDGDLRRSMLLGSEDGDTRRSMLLGSEDGDLRRSMLLGSEDGDPRRSMLLGSQVCYEYFCQSCDMDDDHIEAGFYCRNCGEYMCKQCSTSHKQFMPMNDHDILDLQHMPSKPSISKTNTNAAAVTMATHEKDIELNGTISSSALMSTNQILVSDYKRNIKLVKTGAVREVSEMELPGRPWQVARISDTDAAATIPEAKKIVLLRTQPQLSLVREISVQQECYGIAYTNNRFIVTFFWGHVDILDLSGNVLHTISVDQTGKKIFVQPRYVTVNKATGDVYVSENGWGTERSRLVKLDRKHNVLTMYNRGTFGCPRQVALDGQGMVYVAWECKVGKSGYLDQLGADTCARVRTIVPDLAYQPWALSYDESKQRLYVGHSRGVLRVYRLS